MFRAWDAMFSYEEVEKLNRPAQCTMTILYALNIQTMTKTISLINLFKLCLKYGIIIYWIKILKDLNMAEKTAAKNFK